MFDLVGVCVAWLEEVVTKGWALRFPMIRILPILVVCEMLDSGLVVQHHICLPIAMLTVLMRMNCR